MNYMQIFHFERTNDIKGVNILKIFNKESMFDHGLLYKGEEDSTFKGRLIVHGLPIL